MPRTITSPTMWALPTPITLDDVHALTATARAVAAHRPCILAIHPRTIQAIGAALPARRSCMTPSTHFIAHALRVRITPSPTHPEGVVTLTL